MRTDYVFDLSLRMLMGFIVIVIAGCVLLLAQRSLMPVRMSQSAGPLAEASAQPVIAQRNSWDTPQESTQVLLTPGRIFKCESSGRVTYSDRPCSSR